MRTLTVEYSRIDRLGLNLVSGGALLDRSYTSLYMPSAVAALEDNRRTHSTTLSLRSPVPSAPYVPRNTSLLDMRTRSHRQLQLPNYLHLKRHSPKMFFVSFRFLLRLVRTAFLSHSITISTILLKIDGPHSFI